MKLFQCTLLWLLITTFALTAQEQKNILIFGDSITAGYGVDPEQAFPSILQQKIDSAGLHFKVITGGLSGETSAGGLRRISWVLQRKVDIMILELGGNDGLRGIGYNPQKTTYSKLSLLLKLRILIFRLLLPECKFLQI